jgi:metallo-beta-lactamase class B
MRVSISLLIILIAEVTNSTQAQTAKNEIIISEGLSLVRLSDNLYQHISDFEYESTIVKCNGLIYINGKEAIICDTPTNEIFSRQLLDWFNKNHPGIRIKAIIANHFHADCVGGLREFHRAGIKSYGHVLGPELMKLKKDTFNIPQNLFSSRLEIKVGDKKIVNYHPGEAHTRDNIITWIPSESTVFGGCMVKSMNAGKGNLADANVTAWPATIKKIKVLCPEAKTIVPGHGDAGGQELLDYTIKLFE